MSNTNPTNLPLAPPQSDPYFIGTLHLIGSEPASQSIVPPPTYEAATAAVSQSPLTEYMQVFIAQREQHIKSAQFRAIEHPASKPVVRWGKLITACEKAKAQLEASLVDLEQNWFKAWILQEEKVTIQQHIQAGLEQIALISEAAQSMCEHETADHLNQLQTALDALEAIKGEATLKPAAGQESSDQDGPMARIWKEIREFFGPVILTGWGLIAQSGLLSPEVTKNMPFIGSFIGFGLAIKNRVDAFNEKVTTEDRVRFMEICDSLMEDFMELGKTTLFGDQIKAIRAERDNNIAKFNKKADGLVERFDEIEQRFTRIEASMEVLINLVQKQSNTQHSTHQKTVENPA